MRLSLFQQSLLGLKDLAIGLSIVEQFSLGPSDDNGPFGSPTWFNLKPVTLNTTRMMTVIYSFTGQEGLGSCQ